MPHELLIRKIHTFAERNTHARQVSKRLYGLLPERFRSFKQKCKTPDINAGKAERLALLDPGYVMHLEEYLNIKYDAISARIQYETHMMLFEARRSLKRP